MTEPRTGARRHVVVTGAASGIGAAVCEAFAADGAHISAVDQRGDTLRRTASELRERYGAEVTEIVADLADPDAASAVVDHAEEAAGPVHVLVNAAGIYPAVPLLEMTPAVWDRVMDVNVRAAMLTTVAFARACVAAERGGAVVNISSGAALRARPGAAHYATSKAALEMLTKSCAVEFGPHGIRVNAVSPGFVTVDSDANPVTEEYAAAVSVNPLGRRGLPDDISRAVRWLAGEESPWITGAVLRVDGGSAAGTTALPLHWTGLTGVQRDGATAPGTSTAPDTSAMSDHEERV
ncbi:SDR family oxidoreductase [Streptomyces sp. 150FB]|uniref:SDR family NAD(P)-dependent oxidoreductase n=1 Tax=Streptomyces sp. 150FB TaxID=1576605 RepID=UPI0006973C4B|nr:SDR family oxidoreductase [Streptomyces sp. 150FB]